MSRGCTQMLIIWWAAFILITLIADSFMETARSAEVGGGGAILVLFLYFLLQPRSQSTKDVDKDDTHQP